MTQLIDALQKSGLISEEEAKEAKKIKAENEAKLLREKIDKNKTSRILDKLTQSKKGQ